MIRTVAAFAAGALAGWAAAWWVDRPTRYELVAGPGITITELDTNRTVIVGLTDPEPVRPFDEGDSDRI